MKLTKGFFIYSLCIFIAICSCNRDVQRQVVIYTSVDQIFSEPILKDYERETGVKVEAVYDVEAAKTRALIVTSTPDWRPITVGLTSFITEQGAETQLIMAGSVITTIPILILYFFTQKQFTEGIATTGLKG